MEKEEELSPEKKKLLKEATNFFKWEVEDNLLAGKDFKTAVKEACEKTSKQVEHYQEG